MLSRLGVPQGSAALAGMATVAGLRLAAIWWELKLPIFEVHTAETPIDGPRGRGSAD